MAKESRTERGVVAAREHQFGGYPDKKPPTLKGELPEGMKTPKAPKDSNAHMNSGHGSAKQTMSVAVKHLHKETERHEHVAEVGGHKMYGHSGHMHEK